MGEGRRGGLVAGEMVARESIGGVARVEGDVARMRAGTAVSEADR